MIVIRPFRVRLISVYNDTGYSRAICPAILSGYYRLRLKWFYRKLRARLEDYAWRRAIPSDFKIPKWLDTAKCSVCLPHGAGMEVYADRKGTKIIWTIHHNGQAIQRAFPEDQWMEVNTLIGKLVYSPSPIRYEMSTPTGIVKGTL